MASIDTMVSIVKKILVEKFQVPDSMLKVPRFQIPDCKFQIPGLRFSSKN